MACTFKGYDIFISVDGNSIVMLNEDSESNYSVEEFVQMYGEDGRTFIEGQLAKRVIEEQEIEEEYEESEESGEEVATPRFSPIAALEGQIEIDKQKIKEAHDLSKAEGEYTTSDVVAYWDSFRAFVDAVGDYSAAEKLYKNVFESEKDEAQGAKGIFAKYYENNEANLLSARQQRKNEALMRIKVLSKNGTRLGYKPINPADYDKWIHILLRTDMRRYFRDNCDRNKKSLKEISILELYWMHVKNAHQKQLRDLKKQ